MGGTGSTKASMAAARRPRSSNFASHHRVAVSHVQVCVPEQKVRVHSDKAATKTLISDTSKDKPPVAQVARLVPPTEQITKSLHARVTLYICKEVAGVVNIPTRQQCDAQRIIFILINGNGSLREVPHDIAQQSHCQHLHHRTLQPSQAAQLPIQTTPMPVCQDKNVGRSTTTSALA